MFRIDVQESSLPAEKVFGSDPKSRRLLRRKFIYGIGGTLDKSKPLAAYTAAVYRGALNEVLNMETKTARAGKSNSDHMPRASISFPPEIYKSLEDLAAKKKVSIAWVVREAVEKYIGDEFPLFGTSLLKREQ